MSKALTIAISAMCSAVAFGAIMLATVPGARYAALLLGVLASIAVVIPIMVDARNLVYTLLTYLVASALGVWLGLANIVFVAPIVVFCIPFAIVKVWGESVKFKAVKSAEKVIEDPFDAQDDQKVVEVQLDGKRRLPVVVKWVLYYVLLEAAIGLTALMAYLFTRPVFDTVVRNKLFWVVVALIQVIVYPYDVLMRGCLIGTRKILQKALKPH